MKKDRKRVGLEPGSLPNSEPEFLLAGKLLKPHGLKGELWLKIITDFPEVFFSESHVFVGSDFRQIEIQSIRQAGEKLIITFTGLEDVNGVRPLVNLDVFFSISQMPQLPEGEYYLHQLIGLTAVNLIGEKIGKVTDVLQTGANDIYVIAIEEGGRVKEVLFPAIKSVVKEIDIRTGRMVVDTDGWLE